MRDPRWPSCWTVALALLSATPSAGARAQTTRTITGIVTDSLGAPVRYARVEAGTLGALGNDSGRFVVRLESTNAVTLDIRRIGYRPASLLLPAGGDTTVAVTMYTVAQRLTAVRVIAEQVRKLELSGFYERMADRKKWGGSAQFLTPEDIERRKPFRTTQLFEALNGVSARRGGGCAVVVRCWVAVGHGNCLMTVYLDGLRLQPERYESAPGQRNPVYVDELVHVADLSAIEVYSRPTQAPPFYQSGAGNCGIILIWTK